MSTNKKTERSHDLESLLDAIELLLSEHKLSCVSHPDSQVAPWELYHIDSDGNPLVTEESCQCSTTEKEIRKILTTYRKSRKGYVLANEKDTLLKDQPL